MKCKIGNGLRETLVLLISLVLFVGVAVPLFMSLIWCVGWAQLHLFELGLIVDANNTFDYYMGSGFLFILYLFFIGVSAASVIKALYLVFYKPRSIINFFINCEEVENEV